jgi:hypothetical protein
MKDLLPCLPSATGVLLLLLAFTTSGCAVTSFDAKTGTAHLWGIGHLKMRVTGAENSRVQAVAVGFQTLGARLDATPEHRGVSVGYHNTSLVTIVATDTALRLDNSGSDPFTLRLGSALPAALESFAHSTTQP